MKWGRAESGPLKTWTPRGLCGIQTPNSQGRARDSQLESQSPIRACQPMGSGSSWGSYENADFESDHSGPQWDFSGLDHSGISHGSQARRELPGRWPDWEQLGWRQVEAGPRPSQGHRLGCTVLALELSWGRYVPVSLKHTASPPPPLQCTSHYLLSHFCSLPSPPLLTSRSHSGLGASHTASTSEALSAEGSGWHNSRLRW